MTPERNFMHFKFRILGISLACSYALIGSFWIICMLLQSVGCPLPRIEEEKFLDLGLFIFSNFSFITFLTMMPFQQAEGKLSPGFYVQILNQPWSHFGLSILLGCFILCLGILGCHKSGFSDSFLSQIFVAMIASMIFAVMYHRHRTLRHLYQPIIVYENLTKLAKEENIEDLWLDLYECSIKAIKESRINDARNFFKLMSKIYIKITEKEKIAHMQKDLRSLYQSAKNDHPLAWEMEKQWPFLGHQLSSKNGLAKLLKN
jgi:hypothetical protein